MHPEAETLLTIGREPGSQYHCLLTCDEAYAPYAAVTVASLFQHATTAMNVTLLTPGFSPETLRRFERIEQVMAHALSVVKVPMVVEAFGAEHYWPNATYLRLAAAELVEHDRTLYLDSDLLVRAPLQEIFAFDLGGSLVAGVPEFPGELLQVSPDLNWLGLPPGDAYVNAGVLLMDLAGLRREKFLQTVLEMQPAITPKIRFADQCVLNAGLAGRKAMLPPRWNIRATVMPEAAFHYLLTTGTVGIFHFNGPRKPWMAEASVALRDDWGEYLKLTDYTMDEVCRPASPNYEVLDRHIAEMKTLVRRARHS